MAFDFKKEFKDLYSLSQVPSVVNVPKINYIAVRGKGNPNDTNSEYKKSIELLYAVAYTLKMSYKTSYKIEGFFEYVVPPLEGFWWQNENIEFDYSNKDSLNFISVIRLPDFITKENFDWAIETAKSKKKLEFSKVEFLTIDEGLCVQCLHQGKYDDEPKTIKAMHEFIKKNNYELDISEKRLHHEIYLSDPRKTEESKIKTILRLPIKN